MNLSLKNLARLVLMMTFCSLLASCDDPQVYGSVGFSSYGGGFGGPRMGTSVSIGGRIR
jgi:hypothetical protein